MDVILDKARLDELADAIGIKAERRVPQTIEELVETVASIDPDPDLQAKAITPRVGRQVVRPDEGYDGLSEVVVEAAPLQSRTVTQGTLSARWWPESDHIGLSDITVTVAAGTMDNPTSSRGYVTTSGARKWRYRPQVSVSQAGWLTNGTRYGSFSTYDAIPKNTHVTPSATAQTIGGANVMMEGAVTVDPIPSNYGLIEWDGSVLTVS